MNNYLYYDIGLKSEYTIIKDIVDCIYIIFFSIFIIILFYLILNF